MQFSTTKTAMLDALRSYGGIPDTTIADFDRYTTASVVVALETNGITVSSPGAQGAFVSPSDPQFNNVYNALLLLQQRSAVVARPSSPWPWVIGGGAALGLLAIAWYALRK